MAASTSHSFFILFFFARGVSREAHNQSPVRTCKPASGKSLLLRNRARARARARDRSEKQIEHEQEHEHDYDGRAPACLSSSARLRFARMNKTVIEVQVRAVLPTSGGCAVF